MSSTLTCRAVPLASSLPERPPVWCAWLADRDTRGSICICWTSIRRTRHRAAIYLAELASVDLLPLVYTAGPGCGFVFAQASVLGHLSVVLRERGIAAVRVGDDVRRIAERRSLRIDATDRHTAIHDLEADVSGSCRERRNLVC